MTYSIIIPVYLGCEVIDNLLTSVDVNWSHVILVDNTPESYCKKFEGLGAMIYYYPENIGVSRAWNIGLKAGSDWTILVSQAAVFPLGFSSFLLQIDPKSEFLMTPEGWHCFAIHKSVVEKVGYFDTNFYPAYFEDADYYRRMGLAGIDGDYPKTTPVAITSVGSSSGLGQKINFKALEEYFIEKWGDGPNVHGYKLPFVNMPLTYFPERSVKELQNKYGV